MITHKIVVAVPEVASYQQAVNTVPGAVTTLIPPPDRMTCRTQGDLLAALKAVNCPVGTFVSFDGARVHSLACIHIVAKVEPDFDKVDKRFGRDIVNPYWVVQCDKWSPGASEWRRWDDLAHMRPLSGADWKTYVEPQLDYIQDRCQADFPEGFKISREYRHPSAV